MHQNNKFTESGLRFAHHNKKEDFCLLPLKSLSVVLSSEKGFVLGRMDQSSLEDVLGTPVLAGSRRRVKGDCNADATIRPASMALSVNTLQGGNGPAVHLFFPLPNSPGALCAMLGYGDLCYIRFMLR